MQKYAGLLFFLLYFHSLPAQTWKWGKAEDDADLGDYIDGAVDNKGNIFLLGESRNSVEHSSWRQYDPNGVRLYKGAIFGSRIVGVEADPAGNFIVIGESIEDVAYVEKATGKKYTLDELETIFTVLYGDDYEGDSIPELSNNYIAQGDDTSVIFMEKIDEKDREGKIVFLLENADQVSVLFFKIGHGGDIFLAVEQDGQAFCTAGKDTCRSGNGTSNFLLRFSSAGKLKWKVQLDGASLMSGSGTMEGFAVDSTGAFYCIGNFNTDLIVNGKRELKSKPSKPNPGRNGFVLKIDTDGSLAWSKKINGVSNVLLANNGDVLLQCIFRKDESSPVKIPRDSLKGEKAYVEGLLALYGKTGKIKAHSFTSLGRPACSTPDQYGYLIRDGIYALDDQLHARKLSDASYITDALMIPHNNFFYLFGGGGSAVALGKRKTKGCIVLAPYGTPLYAYADAWIAKGVFPK